MSSHFVAVDESGTITIENSAGEGFRTDIKTLWHILQMAVRVLDVSIVASGNCLGIQDLTMADEEAAGEESGRL